MGDQSKVALIAAGGFVFLSIMFGAATIFVDDFRTGGTAIVGIILAPFATILVTYIGKGVAERQTNGNSPPASQPEKSEGK